MIGKYQLNNIYNENSYKSIKDIPDNSVDLIIIDPPYDFHSGVDFSGMFKDRTKLSHHEIVKKDLDKGIDNNILNDLVRILKNINIYIWCNKEQILEYLVYFKQFNISFEILTWHKKNPTPLTRNTYLPDTEYCLFFREKGKVLLNDGYDLKSKYWVTSLNKKDKELYKHPTIKPLNIIKKMIKHSSQPNDIVADFFLGSGTTCVAAKELNRRYIGFEIDKEYYKISKDRINGITANGQTSLNIDYQGELDI